MTDSPRWHGAPSEIHGNGAFASSPIKDGEVIDMVITGLRGGGLLGGDRTGLGELVNHQDTPNSSMKPLPGSNDKYFLRADSDINSGNEITMNYRDTPWFISSPEQIDPAGYRNWK